MGMDRVFTDVNLKDILYDKESFPLQDGDRIQIFSVMDIRQNIVTISGAIGRPGTYDIGDSLRLKDLILKADGLMGDAYLKRVDIIRINSDFSEKLIKLNLEKVMEDKENQNIFLTSMDQIRVYND